MSTHTHSLKTGLNKPFIRADAASAASRRSSSFDADHSHARQRLEIKSMT